LRSCAAVSSFYESMSAKLSPKNAVRRNGK
jgi:hypothetical protein